MCGIVGVLRRDPESTVEETVVDAMCRRIVHRGPDDQGIFVDRNMGMGMRRLSIIDLGGGHQPIGNEDGSIQVVFNGEIYNYPELREELAGAGHVFKTHSDTETLVHGYEQWGDELPKKLNGMFAFSIWDSRRQRLLLGRDHLGIKPLYLYEDAGQIAWTSEIKALLSLPGFQPRLDPQAVVEFLTFGYVPAPRTMFLGVRKVPPASRVIIENGVTRTEAFWDLTFPKIEKSAAEWCSEIQAMVDDAVRRQLMSDVPLGAFLSGGVDSTAIVATMKRLGMERISTYSIGFGGQDAFHSELSDAAQTAATLGTDHHEIVVEPDVAKLFYPLIEQLDEPITDTSFVVTYLVSKLARESVKVILSGVGGDEIFAGYRRYLGPRLRNLYNAIPRVLHKRVLLPLARRLPVDRGSAWKSRFRYLRGFLEAMEHEEAESYQSYVGIFGSGELAGLLTPEFAQSAAEARPTEVADYYRQAPTDDPINQMMYADVKTALVDSLLAFTDKMTMAVSLEARVPLLDYRLVELAARIPGKLKLKGMGGLKDIFKTAMADRLPEGVANRKKRGFGTPISRWFRGDLKPLLRDLLSPERIRARGYFQPAAVERLIDDHLSERADRSEHLLSLLTFEIWHQLYLDGK
ncbi:MAG: asparagine synthase (glutamine-hydrolyzing) [Planctomycetota bacterium]|nr:asparagine synthase (glutamine-hydrolyzing) [Planctomycetota bacterium]